MHLIIANRIAEKFPDLNRSAFLLGGIAADAVSPKDLSHFYSGDVQDYSRMIDYNGFLDKYRTLPQKDYILGYYTHLIADDLWLKGFYLPWLKNRMEHDPDILRLYHEDFRLLNAKLLDYYGLDVEVLKEMEQPPTAMVDLEEVTIKAVLDFLPYVKGDMQYPSDDLKAPLKVFTLEQIVGYVETSVDKGIIHINKAFGSVGSNEQSLEQSNI
ncbi:zinc dependent phospholipase C family protein [Bacillus tianshenii]|uniref:zinc dependent phospholipase C family protein n=1 Tax=Sutcliffiella tianshenii TaxID=1463404 RepID=UPI001CD2C059|nr:zinc dependent phospholipase C family protein [Bacillus tianshenii]MCA1322406.1 zinc dependent phospholipase C family protein [Bacillus tianshenii]